MLESISSYFPNEYALAGAIFLVLFVFIRIGLFIGGKVTLRLSKNTDRAKENEVMERTSKAFTLLAVYIGILISLKVFPLNPTFLEIAQRVFNTLIMATVAFLIFIIMDIFMVNIIKKMGGKNELARNLQPIMRSSLKIIIIATVLIIGLLMWDVQVGPLLAGLGIAGLALALALQPVLGNLFNGISLLLDETFKVGDVIKLSSGEMGEVYRVGLRTTRIRTFDNEMIIIPNTRVADSVIRNLFQPNKNIRISVEFRVEYGNDPEYIKKIIREEVEKIEMIDKSQEVRILLDKLGESSLDFKVLFWVENLSKKWPAHQEAITRIYRRLYKENIVIPFPQRTNWIRKEDQAKKVTPEDKKFKEVKDKYLSNFGKEYSESDKKNKSN